MADGGFGRADAGGQSLVPITSTSLILSAAIVATGRSIRGEEVVTPQLVTAGVVIFLGIAFTNQIDPLFAATFALLILVAIFLEYAVEILEFVGVNVETA